MDHAALSSPMTPLLLLSAALAAYLIGLERQRRRARRWPLWRTLSFALGIALLAVAFSPPVAHWAHQDLRGHMAQHLLMGMFAPLALVLGAPGLLLLRSAPARLGRRLVRFLALRPIRVLTHPVTACLLDIGGMYVLYLTPLYALSLSNPVVHDLVHLHFVVSGYLFTWAIAGIDPAPHRPGLHTRLAVLFIGTAAHAILGKWMYAFAWPRGTPHALEEIQAAAQWMYYGGDLAELLLAAAFFRLWFRDGRRRERPSRRPAGAAETATLAQQAS